MFIRVFHVFVAVVRTLSPKYKSHRKFVLVYGVKSLRVDTEINCQRSRFQNRGNAVFTYETTSCGTERQGNDNNKNRTDIHGIVLIVVQTEYCGLRSWNTVMKSARIRTSSSVMALYMAARTPPTSLRTTNNAIRMTSRPFGGAWV